MNIKSLESAQLFHILPPAATGNVGLAAAAELAGSRHEIEFRSLRSKSILNRSVSKRQLSLAWSINPYRGCEFGCHYCYARYTHEFLEPTTLEAVKRDNKPAPWAEAFEHKIFLKQNAAWLLERDLRRVAPGQEIALGTATDPYQPIERKEEITRSLLEVFARRSGYRLGIVTKSNLIVRDIDLLERIAERNTLVVHVTITTTDAGLARILEPRAPRPDLRFEAVAKLRNAGLTTGTLCSPLLPGISDSVSALEGVAERAATSRASFFAAQPLFLKSCSRPTYLEFVRKHFPDLLPLYEDHFRTSDFALQPYRKRLEDMVTDVCRKHGLAERSSDALLTRDAGWRKTPHSVCEPAQQALFA